MAIKFIRGNTDYFVVKSNFILFYLPIIKEKLLLLNFHSYYSIFIIYIFRAYPKNR